MKMIEIVALENGAHRNQTYHGVLPDGWALVPDDMEIPNTFPFVDIEVEEREDRYEVEVDSDYDGEVDEVVEVVERTVVVTSMTPGIVPEPTPEPEREPTADDILNAMLGVEA